MKQMPGHIHTRVGNESGNGNFGDKTYCVPSAMMTSTEIKF